MGFLFETGGNIRVGGRDLREFSCRLQSAYRLGATEVETDTFQGSSRSSLLLLGQRFGTLEIVLPLEIWGEDRADTARKWSELSAALAGEVELDLGDGFLYRCVTTDLGKPQWITDEWLSADVTLRGLRQKPPVTISTDMPLGSGIFCASTFPRTDCVITVPGLVLGGARQVSVTLGKNSWYLEGDFTGVTDLVLDGVKKIFLLGGENVTARMDWEDFPYLVPGENALGVFVDGVGIGQGVEIRYRPTFL